MMIAVLIPILGYIYVKRSSDNAVTMPRHYIYDSVEVKTKNGKEYIDTVWHKVGDFSFTNQVGQQVGWAEMMEENAEGKKEGKIVVADFFFTRCPNICPNMTRAMKLLQDGIKSSDKVGNREAGFVHFLSFSVDPNRDSVPKLKEWGDRYGVNPLDWWLLTGDKTSIYDFAKNELRIGNQDGGEIDTNFIHSDRFVLIDKNRNVRGYYRVLDEDKAIDTAAVVKLSEDIVLLSLEKDPNKKFFLAGKLELIAIVFVLLALGLVLLFTFLKKERKKA
jgi:protein SCO1/2